MNDTDVQLDKHKLLEILVRELGDVVDLAVMAGCNELARSLNESLVESKRLHTEALLEKCAFERS